MDPRGAGGRGRRRAGRGGLASAPDYGAESAPKDRLQCEVLVVVVVLVYPLIVTVMVVISVLPRAPSCYNSMRECRICSLSLPFRYYVRSVRCTIFSRPQSSTELITSCCFDIDNFLTSPCCPQMFRGGDTPEGVQSIAKLEGGGIDYLGMKFFSDVFLGLYHDAHGNEVTKHDFSFW